MSPVATNLTTRGTVTMHIDFYWASGPEDHLNETSVEWPSESNINATTRGYVIPEW